MNKYLWFLYSPTDEREREIFSRAYKRVLIVFAVYWFGGFLSMFTPSSWFFSMPGWVYMLSAVTQGLIAYFYSLRVFRGEEIATADTSMFYKGRWYFMGLSIWGIIALTIASGIFSSSIYSQYNFKSIGILLAILYLYLILTTWVVTASWSRGRRILMCVFLPLATHMWVMQKSGSTFARVFRIALVHFVFVVYALMTLSSMAISVDPKKIDDPYYAAKFPANEKTYVDRRYGTVKAGDIVWVYINPEVDEYGQPPRYDGPAEVIGVEGDYFTLVKTPKGDFKVLSIDSFRPTSIDDVKQRLALFSQAQGSVNGRVVSGDSWWDVFLNKK